MFNPKRKKTLSKIEIRFPPPNVKWQKRLRLFIYNPEKKTVLGRNAVNWGKIGLFFLGFYSVLFMISTFMYLFLIEFVISHSEPFRQDSGGLLNGTPGLNVKPAGIEGLIYYKLNDMDTAASYIADIENVLEKFDRIKSGKNVLNCTGPYHKADNQVCHLDKWELFPNSSTCNKKTKFGFSLGKPCFMIKLNKLYGWKPEPYKTLADVPSDFPLQRYDPSSIGIKCDGIYSPDIENIGSINYIPSTGIPFKYFPYLNQKNYMSPFTWVQLETIKRHIMVFIRCKFYIKNINIYHRKYINFVDFNVLID